MNTSFERLVRFRAKDGRTLYGEAGSVWEKGLRGQVVKIFNGSDPFHDGFKLAGEEAEIAEVLCPLASIPVDIGIGLNYRKHAEEGGADIPTHPVVFVKFADTLAGPYEDIPISPHAKELDYEGELTIVIGKDTKDLTETQDPLDFVLGYTVGNDVSARYWQKMPQSAGQHGGAKSFDKFGPIGPVIASLKAVGDPETLKLRTWVNGELRQDGCTDDLIFGVREIVRFLSNGKTLRKGTIIMTGTPSGVGLFFKPPRLLENGDVVEIEIEKIGKIANKMVFE